MSFESALMPFLKRPRQQFDETLPDGRSVQEAVNQSGGYDLTSALGGQRPEHPQRFLASSQSQPAVDPDTGYIMGSGDAFKLNKRPFGVSLTDEENKTNAAKAAASDAIRVVAPPKPDDQYNSFQGALGQQPKLNPTLPPVPEAPNLPQSATQSTPTALSQMGQPPPEMIWNPIVTDQYGKPSISPKAKGNRSDILEKQFEAEQSWEPKAHGNRLVGALKSARDAIRLNARPGMSPGELIGTAIGGLGVGATTRNPDLYAKEIDERKTLGDLSTAMGIDKERAGIANASLVPISVPDGRGGYVQTMVPQGKAAATLQANEKTRQGQAKVDQGQSKVDEAAIQNKAHRDRWSALGRKERKAQITAEYKAGMLRTPEQLQDAADELEISGELQPAFIRGEMRDALDVKGNVIEVNRRTGAVTTPTQSGQAVQSYEVTKEANRNQRAKDFLNASLARQQTQIAATAATYGNADEMESDITDWKQQARDKRTEAARVPIKTQADLDRQRQLTKDASDLEKAARDLRVHANKARNVQSVAPAATSLKGRTITQANFDKYKADHGEAAAQKLLDGGVTIRQ